MRDGARRIRMAAGLLAVTVVIDYLVPWSANNGLPLVFVKHGPQTQGDGATLEFALDGFAGRAAAYALLAGMALLIARVERVSGSYLRQGLWLIAATAVSWGFWFFVDPVAVTLLLPQGVLARWSGMLGQHIPVWAEIYSGWGYARHFWWLVGIHWSLLFALASLVFRRPTDTISTQIAGR